MKRRDFKSRNFRNNNEGCKAGNRLVKVGLTMRDVSVAGMKVSLAVAALGFGCTFVGDFLNGRSNKKKSSASNNDNNINNAE